MHIYIDLSESPSRAVLVDPSNFRAFDVVLTGDARDAEAVSRALSMIGEATGDGHVFIEPAVVKAAAGGYAQDEEWLASFDQMVRYAAQHGWVDERGRIRAHLAEAS